MGISKNNEKVKFNNAEYAHYLRYNASNKNSYVDKLMVILFSAKSEVKQQLDYFQSILMDEKLELIFRRINESIDRCQNLSSFEKKNSNLINVMENFLVLFGWEFIHEIAI